MASLISLALLFLFLFAGMVFSKIPGVSRLTPLMERLSSAILLGLLFFMGFRLGRNEEVTNKLLQIGVVSLTFAFLTVVCTAAVIILFTRLMERNREGGAKERIIKADRGSSGSGEFNGKGKSPSMIAHLHEPVRLFTIVVVGFLTGLFLPLFPEISGEHATSVFLYTLLFFIGAVMVLNGVSIKETLLKKETLFLPLATIAGTSIGGILAGIILDISLGKSLSVAYGFGWYSLSGVIITDLGDPVLGSAGFIANLLRESLALLSIPFLGRTKYPGAAIGVAGATSMDVTLPLIERSCGVTYVPLAISHGAILSLFVPVLVPILFQIG